MAFTMRQLETIERHLPVERVEESAGHSLTLRLYPREVRFLLEAVDHYRDSRCGVEGLGDDCELMYWYESPQGHIERRCEHFCEALIERMLAQLPDSR